MAMSVLIQPNSVLTQRRCATMTRLETEAVAADPAVQDVLLDHERLTRELKIAEEVQHHLLPQSLPEIAGYEFFAFYRAAYEIGGDYYDFVPLAGNRLGIALGDVSGKGVAAALVMAKFSGDTRHHLQSEGSPAAAAVVLNNMLCETGIEERFVTLSLAELDCHKGSVRLCSAGHPPVLRRRADGLIEELGKEIRGLPLGVVPGATYREIEVMLSPGDVIVVYSDGVTDSRNPIEELYDTKGNRRLLNCVERDRGRSGGRRPGDTGGNPAVFRRPRAT